MSKTGSPRNVYRIAEAKAQMADKLGLDPEDPRITISTPDGSEYLIEHPMFRSAQTKADLKPLEDDDSDGIAQVVLGDQYEDFILHDGDPEELLFVFLQIGEDTKTVLAGRKRPTRS